MEFSPQRLLEILECLPAAGGYRVAFSGGMDSTVLLAAMAELQDRLPPLEAIHIHHGLQAQADAWAEHCRAVCARLGVPITVERVDASPRPGESTEAAARRARYAALSRLLPVGATLLTAHHREDQAETLLLQLFRGGGPHGLAAMPEVTAFADGHHARPLLGFARSRLHAWAQAQALPWIEDPSNRDTGFDRNFLRHAVMPALASHWPALPAVLARSAGHFAEAAGLLDTLAAEDWARVGGTGETLPVPALLAFDGPRRRNLLRYWLRQRGVALPDSVHLARIEQEVLRARPDATPQVRWPGGEVRRYRDRLYAAGAFPVTLPARTLRWDLRQPLAIPEAGVRLQAYEAVGQGLRREAVERGVTVGFRAGGERCRPAGRGVSRPLKKLLQEAGVPPWARGRMPLIRIDGRLAQVGGLCCCEPFTAAAGERGVMIEVVPLIRDTSVIESRGEKNDN